MKQPPSLTPAARKKPQPQPQPPVGGNVAEIGGCKGPEPTAHGDWQHKGRATDF